MAASEASNKVTSSDISFEQTPVTDDHIRFICGEVVKDWRDLGTILRLDSASMDIIEANQSNCREVAREVLQKWKKKEGKEGTVGILINALEKIERRDVVEKLLDQRDTMEKDQASQRRSRVKVQQRYDEVDRCSRCPNLEKEINDLKTERDTLKNKNSQLEGMRAEDEKEKEKNRKDTKRTEKIIRKNNTKIADLEKTNRIQLDHIKELKRTNEEIETKKRDLIEEKKNMKKQIEDLKAEKEELKLKLQVQTDPEELDQLKTQNGDLLSQIEELKRKVKSSESERTRLQEELKKSSKFRSPSSGDIPFEQAPVTEIHIRSICGEVGVNWRVLGTVLGLESVLMDCIDIDHSASREKAWKVLIKWKKKEGNGATVGILINALEVIGRRDVIKKLLDL